MKKYYDCFYFESERIESQLSQLNDILENTSPISLLTRTENRAICVVALFEDLKNKIQIFSENDLYRHVEGLPSIVSEYNQKFIELEERFWEKFSSDLLEEFESMESSIEYATKKLNELKNQQEVDQQDVQIFENIYVKPTRGVINNFLEQNAYRKLLLSKDVYEKHTILSEKLEILEKEFVDFKTTLVF